jgi:hypothetical protein
LRLGIVKDPTSIPVIIICMIIAAFTTKLFFFHIVLIAKSQSTYEYLKGHFKNSIFNPYEKSCLSSFGNLLCKKRP